MFNKITFKMTYAWSVVGILWVVSMLNYLDRLMIASMRDPIKDCITMTDAQFGLLTTSFLFIYGIFSPFGGYIADRISRKLVIVISLLVWSIVTGWTGFVNSYEELLTARTLMGISEACYMPAAVALIMDYHKGSTRSLASGILMSGLYAGMALGGGGGYIAEYWGWRTGFQLFGAIGIVYAVFLFFSLKDAQKENPSSNGKMVEADTNNDEAGMPEVIRNLFRLRSYWILMVYGTLLSMTFWVIYAWLPTYFKDAFNLSLGAAGVSATAFLQVASFIGVIVGGIIADRWSRKHIKGRIFVPAIGYIVGGPFLFLMASTGIFGLAIACIVILGLAKGFHDANYMPVICQVVDKRYQATGYGLLTFFGVVAGGIMIYIGGVMRDANISLSLVFLICAISVLISGLLLLAIRPKSDDVS
jgi:predicted MFS family arabinose efflux permease